jgi:anti-anti-sigma factor
MKIVIHGDTLDVSEIRELATATANTFQSQLSAALSESVKHINLDLSETTFVDCGGLGALVAIRKKANHGRGAAIIRLLNPPKPLQHIVSMMKMDDVFPIEMEEPHAAAALQTAHN